MARRYPNGDVCLPPAARAVSAWTDKAMARRGKEKKIVRGPVFLRAQVAARAMMRTGDWAGANALHFVALYDECHSHTYGVRPVEMTTRDRRKATYMASRVLKVDFGGDPAEMAAFMRWAWKRETEREKWKKENSIAGGRITWIAMFSTKMVTDYRVDMHRHAR